MSECPICSGEFADESTDAKSGGWVLLGYVGDKLSADYARETLASNDIPAVIISKSGFLQSGTILPHFFKPGAPLCEISVPTVCVEEAIEIMDMILGDNWQRKE